MLLLLVIVLTIGLCFLLPVVVASATTGAAVGPIVLALLLREAAGVVFYLATPQR